MNLNTSSFFNSNEVHVSSRMNEYMKKNFGYEVEGDIDTLQEAKNSLEVEQQELKNHHYMSKKYIENMLMIETITALLKAHGKPLKEDDESPTGEKYSDDGTTITISNYQPEGIPHEHKKFNLRKQIHRDDNGKLITSPWGGYKVSFHGNPEDVKAYAEEHLGVSESIKEKVTEDDDEELLNKVAEWIYHESSEPISEIEYLLKKSDAVGEYMDAVSESKESVKEDDEMYKRTADAEKGPEHYRWKNDSQLAVVIGRIEGAIDELDNAIQYRGENSANFFNNGDKAGVGGLMGIKQKLEDIHSEWDKNTEYYGM